jgi:putative chitinase
MTWTDVLRRVAPQGHTIIFEGFAAAMPAVIKRAGLTNTLLQAHFLAQTAEESAGFRTTKEYASGREYEGRHDLGNIHPGDGERYKGRGLIQITGRANYAACSKFFAVDFLTHPELLETFPYAAYAAAFYWNGLRKLNKPAARDDLRAVTRGVNGGLNGLNDRAIYLRRAKGALAHANI